MVRLQISTLAWILIGPNEVGLQKVQISNGIWNLEAQPVEIRTNGHHFVKKPFEICISRIWMVRFSNGWDHSYSPTLWKPDNLKSDIKNVWIWNWQISDACLFHSNVAGWILLLKFNHFNIPMFRPGLGFLSLDETKLVTIFRLKKDTVGSLFVPALVLGYFLKWKGRDHLGGKYIDGSRSISVLI